MLHSFSMSPIFLVSSSFFISSCWIISDSDKETRSACPEISLWTLFSRCSRCILRSLNRTASLFVSSSAFPCTFLLCSCRLWTLFSVSSLSEISFCRTFLSCPFFISEASSRVSTWCPRCSSAKLQDAQIMVESSVQ
ncbi:hypothetical protein AB205_0088710 [Aquarana catesbeiana]|uniref:Secreted protein n=1 Tax=Aquarana catesbeiana TaxID=8400 RepID=A0A2G9R4S3_AQUCT|nr:hypothetical protein AB205_0088710 [Aquarana catesbeiana]